MHCLPLSFIMFTSLLLVSSLCLWSVVSCAPVCNLSLDILFVQDATTGFADDFAQFNEQKTISSITRAVKASHPSARFGLLSFRDKPLWPVNSMHAPIPPSYNCALHHLSSVHRCECMFVYVGGVCTSDHRQVVQVTTVLVWSRI